MHIPRVGAQLVVNSSLTMASVLVLLSATMGWVGPSQSVDVYTLVNLSIFGEITVLQ